jgi:syntaxin-binding protein 1
VRAVPVVAGTRLNYPATASEAQTFSLQAPELFFGLYSPPRSDSQFKAARDRLEEELRFAAKVVRPCVSLLYIRAHADP